MLAIKRFFRWEDKTNISDNWLVRRKYIHSSPENFYLSTKPELPFLFFTYKFSQIQEMNTPFMIQFRLRFHPSIKEKKIEKIPVEYI